MKFGKVNKWLGTQSLVAALRGVLPLLVVAPLLAACSLDLVTGEYKLSVLSLTPEPEPPPPTL